MVHSRRGVVLLLIAVVFSAILSLSDAKYIYAGGDFQYNADSAAVMTGSGIWDLSQSLWIEIGLVGGSSASVRASQFVSATQTLFVGGRFTSVGSRPSVGDVGVNSTNVASWRADVSVWQQLTTSGNGFIRNLAVSDSHLFVTGSFGVLNGVQTGAVGMASLTDGTWTQVPPSEDTATSINSLSGAYAVAVYGDSLIVGGAPTLATTGGAALGGLAITGLNSSSAWIPLGNGICGGHIYTAVVIDDTLIIGGNFTGVSDINGDCSNVTTANGLAAFNLVSSTWSDLSAALPLSSVVYSVVASSTNESTNAYPLYVVGDFNNLAGSFNRLAKYDGVTWAAVSSTELNATGTIYAIVELDGDIFVGGSFSNDELNIHAIAKWSTQTSSWDNLDGGLLCFHANETVTASTCTSPVVYTLSTFPEKDELVPPATQYSWNNILDFFDWQGWSIIFAGLIGAAMVFSIFVNVCFKCCAKCRK